MDAFTLALVVLFAPLAAAAIIAIVWPLRYSGVGAAALSLFAAVSATLAVVLLLVQGGAEASFEAAWLPLGGSGWVSAGLRLDGVSKLMLLVVTVVATMVQTYSFGYLHDEEKPAFGRYYGLQSLFLFSMNLCVLAPNLLQLFIGWELVGVTSYLLIGYFYRKPSAGAAALKAFSVTKLADLGFLLGLVLLYVDTGGFAWQNLPATTHFEWIALLLFIAVMGKSAQFPLHIWLPDAMEGPTPVSALLHAATMVAAGVFLVVRAYPLFAAAPDTMMFMTYVGATSALLAAGIAAFQSDIKRVLAYSTCSQLGYMFAGLGAGSLGAGFLHLTTHAFFKALLFLAAGSVIHAVHSNQLERMGGLWKRMPVTTLAFCIGSAALVGIPGFSGFFSKDAILEQVGEHAPLALAMLMVTVGLTAFYVGRVVLAAFFGKASDPQSHAHEPGVSMLAPLVILSVPALGLGFFSRGLAESFGAHYALHFGGITFAAVGTSAVGLLAAGVAQARGMPAIWEKLRVMIEWGAFNRAYRAVYDVLRSGASLVSWFDRYVIDGAVNASAWLMAQIGTLLRRTQTGSVADYMWAVFATVIVLAGYGLLR